MTLDQIWRNMNQDYARVKELTRQIQINMVGSIGINKMLVQDYLWWVERTFNPSARDVNNQVAGAVLALQNEITAGYTHLDSKINQYQYYVESAFKTYMDDVLGHIEQAVELVWAEAIGGGGDLRGYIDRAIDSVIDRMDSEIYYLELSIDSDISQVRNLVTQKYNQVRDWVNNTFGGVWDWIADSVDDIWRKSKKYAIDLFADAEKLIASIYNDLEDAIGLVTTKVINYYNQAKKYVEEKFNEAAEALRVTIENIDRAIARTITDIKEWTNGRIRTVKKKILKAVDIVQTALNELAILTDWRFDFFNWTVIRPELSMLSVLIRDDETFNYYKPYWQAFLARVLEED